MKSITPQKNKKGLSPMLMTILAILMVLILVFTCAKVGVINIPGISPDKTPENVVQIGYTESAASAGTQVSSVIKFKTIILPDDIEEEPNAVIADDAITPDMNLDGYVLKLDLSANTPLSKSMVCPVATDDKLNDTARLIEVSYVTLSTGLKAGDFVDIRLKVSNSKNEYDYRDDIVVAKKEIVAVDGTTVTLKLNEDELISLTAAAVDMTIANSTKNDDKPVGTLYTTQYIHAGQARAEVTYNNPTLTALLKANPNLLNNPSALYETVIANDK